MSPGSEHDTGQIPQGVSSQGAESKEFFQICYERIFHQQSWGNMQKKGKEQSWLVDF